MWRGVANRWVAEGGAVGKPVYVTIKTTRCKHYVYGPTLIVVLVIVLVIVLIIVIVIVVVIAIVVVMCACFPSRIKLWSLGSSFVLHLGQSGSAPRGIGSDGGKSEDARPAVEGEAEANHCPN